MTLDKSKKVPPIPWYQNLKSFHLLLIAIGSLTIFVLTDYTAAIFDWIFLIGIIFAGIRYFQERKEKQLKSSTLVTDEEKLGARQINQSVNSSHEEATEFERDFEFGGIYGAKPRKDTEAYRVKEEAARRKKLAEEKGVKELATELYFDDIQYYPSWLKNEKGFAHVSKLVTNATKLESGKKKEERHIDVTELLLKDKKYRFEFSNHSFSLPDGDYANHGLLDLFIDGKRVLGVNLSNDYEGFDPKWKPFGIEAFIDGEWINDLMDLKKAIQMDTKEKALMEAEDPDKIKKLKKDFGIE